MRVFFAIDFSAPITAQINLLLLEMQRQISNPLIRWVKQFHITLQFLAAVEPIHIPQLVERVQDQIKSIPAFQLQLGQPEFFPSTSAPKVISLSIPDQENLIDLSTAVGKGISNSGYSIETRPFHPHLTLGRLEKKSLFDLLPHSIIFPKITIHRIVLFQSQPTSEGSQYTVLAQIPLKD